MSYYDEQKTVREYISMAEGYDGKLLIAALSSHLDEGAQVLELGMGPGKDLDLLSERYRVTGSDRSQTFIDLYLEKNPKADVLRLDAVTLEMDRSFDCIYSNKVMQHLSDSELRKSIERQSQLLNEGGFVLHSFWKGSGVEENHRLKCFNRLERDIESVFAGSFKILELKTYKEFDPDDSIYVIAKRL